MFRFRMPLAVLLLLLGAGIFTGVQSQEPAGRWVTTWSGAAERYVRASAIGSAMPAPEFRVAWEQGILNDQTVRIVVRPSISGSRVRIRLSNEFGEQPLTIRAARIAAVPATSMRPLDAPPFVAAPPVAGAVGSVASTPRRQILNFPAIVIPVQNTVIAGTSREILFAGQPSVTIPPRGTVVSDPVDFEVRDRGFLAVSLYAPGRTEPATLFGSAATASVFLGDATAWPGDVAPLSGPARGSFWLSGVDVSGSAEGAGIVVIDDDSRWRDGLAPGAGWRIPFADRLLSDGGSERFAVLDLTLSDCPITQSCRSAAVDRIQYAAQNMEGVEWVVLAAGFDDILNASYDSGVPGQEPLATTADDIISALQRAIDAAHAAGLKIAGATYPPFGETRRYTEKGEAMRAAVNAWIRSSQAFDAVVDFDRAVLDPDDPRRRQAAFVGENDFLGYLGFQALASSFDLSVFTRD